MRFLAAEGGENFGGQKFWMNSPLFSADLKQRGINSRNSVDPTGTKLWYDCRSTRSPCVTKTCAINRSHSGTQSQKKSQQKISNNKKYSIFWIWIGRGAVGLRCRAIKKKICYVHCTGTWLAHRVGAYRPPRNFVTIFSGVVPSFFRAELRVLRIFSRN